MFQITCRTYCKEKYKPDSPKTILNNTVDVMALDMILSTLCYYQHNTSIVNFDNIETKSLDAYTKSEPENKSKIHRTFYGITIVLN